jgi:SAP domain
MNSAEQHGDAARPDADSGEISAGGAGSSGASQPKFGRVVYTTDALVMKTLKQLKKVCKSRSLPVSGNKQDLVQRIVKSQLGPDADGSAGP